MSNKHITLILLGLTQTGEFEEHISLASNVGILVQ